MDSYTDRFGSVIDVTEHGADTTGTESVTGVLRDLADDDTLLYFPDGEYYMDEQFRFTDFTNFGLAGDGATFVPADYHNFDGPQYRLFRLGVDYAPGKDLLVENLTVDQTAADTGIRVIDTMVTDGLEVRNVDVQGYHDSGTWGPGFFSVIDPDGSGVVEGFRAPDGGEWVSNTPNDGNLWRGPSGIILSQHHKGSVTFRNCELGGFPDNGLYGVTDGTVNVVGGTYANSNAASVRLAGDDCTVRDVTVRVDENPTNFENQRGIRLDGGSNFTLDNVSVDLQAPNGHAISILDNCTSARIDDSKVTIADTVNHGIVISPNAGRIDIVNTDVEIHGGGNAIQINGSDAGKVVCELVQIWGQASGSTWRHAIRCNRNDCEFRGVDVWQPGPDMRRAIVLNGDNCLIYGGVYKARHHAGLINGSGEWVEDTHMESYDNYEAVRLNDSSSDVTLKSNTLENGVLDMGCEGLSMYGNTT